MESTSFVAVPDERGRPIPGASITADESEISLASLRNVNKIEPSQNQLAGGKG